MFNYESLNYILKLYIFGSNNTEGNIFETQALKRRIEINLDQTNDSMVLDFIERIKMSTSNKKNRLKRNGFIFEKKQDKFQRNNYTLLLQDNRIGYLCDWDSDDHIYFVECQGAQLGKWKNIEEGSLEKLLIDCIQEQIVELKHNGSSYFCKIIGKYGDRYI